ncbi:MAG: AraC family transcriptional regulator [Clostridia bacterium]
MTLQELMDCTGAKLITPDVDVQRTITTGYSCDLLSWVLAHGQAGMAWVTVQTHLNVIAVAMLMDMACVIIPEGIEMEAATLQKAIGEGVPVLVSEHTAYTLCGMLYEAGVGQAARK